MPTVIESLGEFQARHSADGPVVIDRNGEQLCADGALIGRMGQLVEPPLEPGALLQAKRRYVAVKLRLEQEGFDAFKKDCEEKLANQIRYANPLPGPPANAKELLEAGAKRIKQLREELNGLDREISQLPDERARRAFEEQRRANQQSAREQLSQIAGMTI